MVFPVDGSIDRASSAVSDTAGIDPLLAGGGNGPALHELVAADYGSHASVRNFGLALIASLLHRKTDDQGMVLWCQRQHDMLEFGRPYGPGLRDIGLPPDRLLMVTGRRDADCLWAMEQGLASRSLFAVVGMVDGADLIATRRLSLAASAHGTFCFLLPIHHGREPSAARIRWRIRSASSRPDHLDPKGLGLPAWHLDLERSPNGRNGHWTVEWDHAAHHFHRLPHLANQPAARRGSPDRGARRNSENKQASDIIAFDRTG